MTARRNVLAQYSLLTFAIILILAVLLGLVLSRNVTDYLIRSHLNLYPNIIHTIMESNRRITDFLGHAGTQVASADLPEDVGQVFEDILSFGAVFRIKVWNTGGTILWSDCREIIGKNFVESRHFQKALHGEVSYEIGRPDTTEQLTEQAKSSVLEIYIPVQVDGRIAYVFELYEADQELYEQIRKNLRFVWLLVILFGGSLYILQFFIFYGAYRRQLRTHQQLLQTQDVTIFALAYQAELRDFETGKHIERTAAFVGIIAEELSHHPEYGRYLTPSYIDDLVKSAPLHDIGKSGIPDAILRKPGRLTEQEFDTMKHHCEYGAMILKKAEEKLSFRSFLAIAVQLTLSHHEKWNGTGYPQGLKGEDIPLSGRIMALADVYDALRSRRVYKDAFPHEKCKEIIRKERGAHFDPTVVDAFLKHEMAFLKISEEQAD